MARSKKKLFAETNTTARPMGNTLVLTTSPTPRKGECLLSYPDQRSPTRSHYDESTDCGNYPRTLSTMAGGILHGIPTCHNHKTLAGRFPQGKPISRYLFH
ncbi:hypothetical protein NPIL_172681 [Nephila pilipes]|uniref:Uncharacterized protein n=1 Tax=Nephila pilipes TaxID=299642 RepID=A0A8X6NIC2_NEPPI|nr:hypothetical protein NPIL_172681 [Nephila pilipes]